MTVPEELPTMVPIASWSAMERASSVDVADTTYTSDAAPRRASSASTAAGVCADAASRTTALGSQSLKWQRLSANLRRRLRFPRRVAILSRLAGSMSATSPISWSAAVLISTLHREYATVPAVAERLCRDPDDVENPRM